jgi:hypothetical protein
MRFGAIEFAKQAGAGNLTQAIPQHTVRVHSIGLAESLLLSPGEIVERLERAAQERNIRVLYLRAAGADTATLREILQQLEQRLHPRGLRHPRVGRASVRRVAAPQRGSSRWWGWAWAYWRAGC